MEKEISIELPTNEDEMLPRQCPNCEQQFLIQQEEYEAGGYLNLRCPYCEWIDEKDEFLTDEQVEYAEAVAMNEMKGMLEKELGGMLEDAFSGLKSNDFITIEKGSSDFKLDRDSLPSPSTDASTTKQKCDECEFSFETINSSVVCPVCRE